MRRFRYATLHVFHRQEWVGMVEMKLREAAQLLQKIRRSEDFRPQVFKHGRNWNVTYTVPGFTLYCQTVYVK